MKKKSLDLRILQDSFLRERIFGFRELSDEKIRERMNNLELGLNGPFYCVILFAPYLMRKNAAEIDKLLMKLLTIVREEYLRAGINCWTISDNYCNVVAVLSLDTAESYSRLNKLTSRMANELIRHYDVDMFVGIGEMVDSMAALNRSKDTAAEALAHKFTFSQDHVITAKDVKRYYNQGDEEMKKHYDRILGCFYDGNMDLLEVRLRDLFAQVCAVSDNELDSIRNVCIELTATLLRVVREMGVPATPEMNGIYTYIASMESIAVIGEWFLGYCAGLVQKVSELRKDKTQQIIEQADRYIETRLGNPELTIQAISDHVALSAAYFSNIFFRAKGIHLNEYINRARVREAQKCLLDSNEKVSAIAQNMGFTSSSYFNSVFRRYTGMTPKQFRESGRNKTGDNLEKCESSRSIQGKLK